MLNLRETENSKIFVTSDTHFHHNREFVWKSRGFTSIKEHDDFVINNLNENVKKDDILFHLGDFCLNTTLLQFEELLSRIVCQNIYMLFGNHPNPHYKGVYKKLVQSKFGVDYTDASEIYPLRYKNVVYIGNYQEVILNGHFVVLSHYPLYIWNECQNGSWMLCGHSHGGCIFSQPTTPEGKILDCGWDLHEKPLSFEDVNKIMSSKKFVQLDGHHTAKSAPTNPLNMPDVTGANFSAS